MIFKGRRVRALLQSFDAARYHNDNHTDREADLAQARCEALNAILFGNEIVIPAGAIADSPAFAELFHEVMVPGRKALEEINNSSPFPYQPFRIGLEPQFSSYDDFVQAYLKDNMPGSMTYVKLKELAIQNASTGDNTWMPALAGEAYLRKDWKTLESIDARYAQHARLVDEYFGSSAIVKPVHASGSVFSDRDENDIRDSLLQYLNNARESEIDFTDYIALEKEIEALFRNLEHPEQRGRWYHNLNAFGEHWQFIRTWLDFDLFEIMRRTYEVQLPSYFTQEVFDREVIKRLVLVPTGRQNALRYFSNEPTSEDAFSIFTDQVDWPQVWSRVSHKEIVKSTNEYQADIAAALSRRAVDDEEREVRGRLIRAATESHIQTLNSYMPFLHFEMDHARTKLRIRVEPQETKNTELKQLVGSAVSSALGAAVPGAGLLASTVIGTGISASVDYALRSRETHISALKRDSQLIELRKGMNAMNEFVTREMERMNFWISLD